MAGTTAHESRSLDLGSVEELRVRVGYSRSPDGPEHDVFLLDLPLTEAAPYDEAAALEALAPVLSVRDTTTPLFTVQVERRHANWGWGGGQATIRIGLARGRDTTLSDADRDASVEALGRVIAHAGAPYGHDLGQEDALARARARVEQAFPAVRADGLAVDGQDHPAPGRWLVRLRDGLERYEVEIGCAGGFAGSAHVRHLPTREVLDSVGTV